MSDKVDFKTKTRYKIDVYNDGSVYQEIIIIMDLYVHNELVLNYIKKYLYKQNNWTNPSYTGGIFDTPLNS